ncbi:37S ribosomal protein S28 [Kluyveromyces marxianus]|uniref:37S ribosomal protein S28 n=2 Tax=Kluyveromyces marxianus TaxID=4911 RepID=W0TB35_KLUMD|nr:37S ribosomal protein S28 [Kluyveromyces marxianus DMKU3-1042]QGN15995.1 37S ribosomal protein S28 [Kluyveromyces marxianus]BAO40263.1 37S ribosomal protein S28 [Kluyveromyces marxianus DMKU3-1042]
MNSYIVPMLRTGFVRPLARPFSSTAIASSTKSVKFLKAQRRKQLNEAKQNKIKNSLDDVDPVLGRPDTPFINRVMAELQEPNVLIPGYERSEVEKLLVSIEETKKTQASLAGLDSLVEDQSIKDLNNKHEAIFRILNMRNASNAEALKMAIKLAREEFQRFPGDTGSSEVQAAVMTVRIQNLAKHVKENKKDFKNIRALRMLVQQRQSILRYLKRDKPDRYFWAIQKLGLSDNAAMSEFNMDRRYMQQYKFFGDVILIKDSNKVADAKRKAARKEKMFSSEQ